MLHNDHELFEQPILKELVSVSPDIIFKGRTSLSKCYHLIDRFPEDIDLNIETETKPSESRRKHLKSSIVRIIESGLFIT